MIVWRIAICLGNKHSFYLFWIAQAQSERRAFCCCAYLEFFLPPINNKQSPRFGAETESAQDASNR